MAYQYDPSKYLNDYSWVGDIGNSISKFAYQVPEIVQLNKTIKENNKAKDILYSSLNKYIDKLDPNIVSNITSSMKLDVDPNAVDADKARREALKKNIPTFSSITDNEKYAKSIVDYFVPVLKAAQSTDGGGALSMGDLLAGLDNNKIAEGVMESSYGKEQTEKSKYQLGREREQSEYDLTRNRKLGPGGELETTNKINAESAMNQTKQTAEFNKQQGVQVANEAQQILSEYEQGNPESIMSDPAFKDFSLEAKKEAYRVATDETNRDFRKQLEDARNQIKKDLQAKEDLPKIYDQTQLEQKLMDVRSKISDWAVKLKGFKKEQKGQPEYTTLEQNVEQAKLAERAYVGALKYLGSNPKATQEQVNTAMSVSRQNIDPEDEQKFIADWKGNVYGSSPWNIFALGQKDDLERFKKAYNSRFGKEPQVRESKDEKGKTIYEIVPQFGSVKDVVSTTNTIAPSTNTNTSGTSETAAMLSALKAELERRKQQGQ